MEFAAPVLACLLGLSGGMRTFTPLAVISAALYFGFIQVDGLPAHLGTPLAFGILSFSAISELIGDKTPFVPDRTGLVPLLGRMFSGGLAGYTLAIATHGSGLIAAVAGVVGAVAGTYGGFAARRYLTKQVGAPDFAVAIVEDAVSISLALLACYLAV